METKPVYSHKLYEKGCDVHVLFYIDNRQVGAAVFLDDDEYDEFLLAAKLAQKWDGLIE